MLFDFVGVYTFRPQSQYRSVLFIDDVRVVDTASSPVGTYYSATAATRRRVRLEISSTPATLTQTFTHTGGAQAFTVPTGVTELEITANGAAGAAMTGSSGGAGGLVNATIPVTQDEPLQVNAGGVGGSNVGGWNGGGSGVAGGGGASDVRQGGTALAHRVVVAGGGGGGVTGPGFASPGGAGGGTSGAPATLQGGSGGTQSAGGSSGGQLGVGGDGDGGGGGGYYGGGALYSQNPFGFLSNGGGGGSGYVTSSASSSSMTMGGNNGNGAVTITWSAPTATQLRWTPPGASDAIVPGSKLSPRYGLATSTTDADGKTTATEYDQPELGLAAETIVDPAGLALTSTATYETGAGTFRRQLTRTLPKGAATEVSYSHYGATETRANPCASGSPTVNQAGLVELTTDADPDGAGSADPIERERVHDVVGRVVASRVVGDAAWTCVSYDARGRATTSTARNGDVSTVDHSTPGTVISTFEDSSGTTRTTTTVIDLLGRPVTYTDEWGTITRTVYDQPGRITATYRTFNGSSETQVTSATYDAAGRVLTSSDHLTGSARTTTHTYDAAGRIVVSTLANGVTRETTYDAVGRVERVFHGGAAAPTTTTTFTHTAAAQSWTVPAGVTAITIEAWGAGGGAGGPGFISTSSPGGLGGYATGTITVTPGETLQVNVGGVGVAGGTASSGPGGFNGGGSSPYAQSASAYPAGSGGGASDVRRGGTALSNRVLVAGGGGGAGSSLFTLGGSGGSGGASIGAAGATGTPAPRDPGGGGGAGTASFGGSGGLHVAVDTGYTPRNGSTGNLGTGGAGGGGQTSSYPGGSGGGGGGGHYGGGGGAGGFDGGGGGGGGGGSNYLGTASSTSSSAGVRSGNGEIKISYTTSLVPTSVQTYTVGGRVATDTLGTRARGFTYDGAGRLIQTVEGATTRTYAYDANTNRCALATTCAAPTFTYDNADRITQSPYASAYTYDHRGNTIATTGTSGNPSVTIAYDVHDHATTINDGTTTVTETLAPTGRVLRRVVTTNATSTVTEDVIYGYAGGGDAPSYSRSFAGGNVTTYLGGMIDVAGTAKWTLGNIHGDVIGTTNAGGTFTAAPATDEYGVGGTTTDRYGWLGTHQRPTTHTTLGIIRMGVRLYDPLLGRFLQVDPVAGGSCNDYDYVCADPVNMFDLSGEKCEWCEAIVRLVAAQQRQREMAYNAAVWEQARLRNQQRAFLEAFARPRSSISFSLCRIGCANLSSNGGLSLSCCSTRSATLTVNPSGGGGRTTLLCPGLWCRGQSGDEGVVSITSSPGASHDFFSWRVR